MEYIVYITNNYAGCICFHTNFMFPQYMNTDHHTYCDEKQLYCMQNENNSQSIINLVGLWQGTWSPIPIQDPIITYPEARTK